MARTTAQLRAHLQNTNHLPEWFEYRAFFHHNKEHFTIETIQEILDGGWKHVVDGDPEGELGCYVYVFTNMKLEEDDEEILKAIRSEAFDC